MSELAFFLLGFAMAFLVIGLAVFFYERSVDKEIKKVVGELETQAKFWREQALSESANDND